MDAQYKVFLAEVTPADGGEYTPSNCLPKSGKYYLTVDVTLTETHYITSGTLNLCLNGHSITKTSHDSVLYIESGAALNLFDENGNAGKITHGKDGGGNVYSGAGVYVDSGTFTMNGGSIEGNTATNDNAGGGVYVENGTFTMNGGSIEGNTASGSGGGVYAYGSSITMSGGSIEGNTIKYSSGGGAYVNNGTFTMNGGSIEGNTADYGGGAYVDNCTFTMSGGSIEGNTAGYGGGVYVNNGSFTMNGGSIESNTATYGGGVIMDGCTFTMKGGSIEGNTAKFYGGGVVLNGSKMYMFDGTIKDNKFTGDGRQFGGGVYLDYGGLVMSDGSISGNEAVSGGGAYSSNSTIIMLDGSISNNQAMTGGGVFNKGQLGITQTSQGVDTILSAIGNAEFTEKVKGLLIEVSGEPGITSNQAQYGGGVYNDQNTGYFFIDTGSITKNKAQYGGGVLNNTASGDVLTKSLSAAEAGGRYGDSRQEQVKSASSLPSGVYLAGNPTISGNTDSEGQDNLALTAQEAGFDTSVAGADDAQSVQYAVSPIHIMGKLTNTTPIGVTILLKKNSVNDLIVADASTVEAERVGGVFTSDLPDNGDESNFVSDSEDFGVTLVTEGDLKGEAQLLPAVKASAEDVTVNYDGKAHSITVKTEPEGAKVVYSTDDGKTWSETNPSFTEAGKYTVSYKAEAEGYAPATGKATVTIKGGAVKASAVDVTATYDGKAHSITVKTETKGATVSYSTDGKTWSKTNPGFTEAGKYTVSYKVEAEGGVPATGKATVTINAKAVTATADNKSSVYNKKRAALTFTVTGLVKDADKDSLKITASTKAKKGSDAGQYDITLKQDTAKASKNYKVTLKKGTYTIEKATQKAPSAPKVSKKYWTYFAVKKVEGLEYKLSGRNWGSSFTFENLYSGTTYKVCARKAADKNHYASEASEVTEVKLPAAHLSANAVQTGSSLTVKWSKKSRANSYEVYVWYCGDKKPKKPTVTKTREEESAILTKLNRVNLNTRKSITVKVVAKQGKVAVAESLALHVAGSGNRSKTNATGIDGMPKRNKLTVDLEKSEKLNLTARKNGKAQLLDEKHGAAIRLVSSDKRIISVNGTTLIGKGKGTCKVYVCTLNGIEQTIKVTVK